MHAALPACPESWIQTFPAVSAWLCRRRASLLSTQYLSAVLCCAAGVFDVSDVQQLLRWLDSLARNPKGTDDVKAVTGVLPPVQKLVLQLLGQLNVVRINGLFVFAAYDASILCSPTVEVWQVVHVTVLDLQHARLGRKRDQGTGILWQVRNPTCSLLACLRQ